jgi:hypothetical protein
MHIKFETLIDLVSRGVPKKQVKGIQLRDCEGFKSIPGAMHNGLYIGSPGKDIFLMLPYLSDKQMEDVSDLLSGEFPYDPPSNHVNTAACIRFIYGQFEKQGTLRSDKDFKRMKKDIPDWTLPRKFISMLKNNFKEKENYYGLSILAEMEGHRLGDEYRIYKDIKYLKNMELEYVESVNYAYKCKSYKQMFTPYFWAAMYFIKCKNREKALKYCKLTIDNAEKYCPDSRPSYVDKLFKCLDYIRKKDKKKWSKYCKNLRKTSKNRCLKKTIKKISNR